jgi:hypothetical protein
MIPGILDKATEDLDEDLDGDGDRNKGSKPRRLFHQGAFENAFEGVTDAVDLARGEGVEEG